MTRGRLGVHFEDMKTYKIEKGIKVPPIGQRNGEVKVSLVAATMNELGKGESFLVKSPLEMVKAEKVMRDYVRRERARDGDRAFTSRRIGGGVRIWRTK